MVQTLQNKEQLDPLFFCYWLQGYAEITGTRTAPTAEEWQIIKDHLNTVFNKVTPYYAVGGAGVPWGLSGAAGAPNVLPNGSPNFGPVAVCGISTHSRNGAVTMTTTDAVTMTTTDTGAVGVVASVPLDARTYGK